MKKSFNILIIIIVFITLTITILGTLFYNYVTIPYNYYHETDKESVSNKFILGSMVYFISKDSCRLIIYEVEAYDADRTDVTTKEYSSFVVGTPDFNNLSPDKNVSKQLAFNLGFAGECFREEGYLEKLNNLENNKNVIYSYHKSFHQFMFYDIQAQLLYHLRGS